MESVAPLPLPGWLLGNTPGPGQGRPPAHERRHTLMADLYAVAAQHMTARKMSLRALAAAVPCNAGYLSKVLRGLRPCSRALASAIDAALNAGGDVIKAAESRAPLTREAPVAPEVAGWFRSQLAAHYEADMFLGPLHLIPILKAQAEQLALLAGAADAPVRQGLLDTSTAYAALLGWLYQDAGDLRNSAAWRDVTLSWAHRSGDPQLISYALANKAMLALDQGDGRAVADFAAAALADEKRLMPKVRVIALVHRAQGLAMTGDRPAADRLLDQAAALAPRIDDEHPWGNSSRRTPHHAEVQRATCWGRTGSSADASDAARLWGEIMTVQPVSARRDNAVFRARMAGALARVPDPEAAVAAAREAASAVAVTGSARLKREIAGLPKQARAWARTPPGRDLAAVVASVA